MSERIGNNIDLDNNYESTIAYLKSLQPQDGLFSIDYSYACYVGLYLFALEFSKNKIVLDAASGLGYGSFILADQAKKVVGIDILEKNVKFASKNYSQWNLMFNQMNVLRTGFKANTFDVIVSIETFEHLQPAEAKPFIYEMKRILKPSGKLILSTPNRSIHSQFTKTEDHYNELNVDELHERFSPNFELCEFYYQRKGVLKEMNLFYSIIKSDKLNLRSLIPSFIRRTVNKFIANDITQKFETILPNLLVHKAESLDDVKESVIQMVVCQK
jgi:SAM-dependent methyltransferase